MGRQIAHRPRYRLPQAHRQLPLNSRQQFLRMRWTFRSQKSVYEKPPFGYSLALIPLQYRWQGYLLVHRG